MMPKDREPITEIDDCGEPILPMDSLGPYKTSIEVLIKDNIPIKYRTWVRKEETDEWVVPRALKDTCCETFCVKFIWLEGYNEEPVKKRVMSTWQLLSRTSRGPCIASTSAKTASQIENCTHTSSNTRMT